MTSVKLLLIISVLVTSVFCAPSAAVDIARSGIHVGLTSGQFSGNMPPSSAKKGLLFGLHAAERIIGRVHYQMEVNYVQKGVETHLDFEWAGTTYEQVETTVKYDYVEIPLLIKVGLGRPDTPQPIIFGGPYVAWILEKNVVSSVTVVDDDVTYDMEIHNYLDVFQPAKSDWGVTFGLALENISVTGLKWNAQVRYSRGMKDVVESPSGSQLSNSVLSLLLGVNL